GDTLGISFGSSAQVRSASKIRDGYLRDKERDRQHWRGRARPSGRGLVCRRRRGCREGQAERRAKHLVGGGPSWAVTVFGKPHLPMPVLGLDELLGNTVGHTILT